MSSRWNAPHAVHEFRTFAVMVILLALPVLRFAATDGEPDLTVIAGGCAAVASVATLCAGVSFYIRWRLTAEHRVAWLATALIAISIPHFYWFALMAGVTSSDSDQFFAFATTIALTALALAGTLFVDRLPANPAPLAAGAFLGVVILAVRALVVAAHPASHLQDLDTASVLTIAVANLAVLVIIVRLAPRQPWIRLRLMVALGLMAVAQVATQLVVDQVWLLVIAVVSGTIGAAILVCLAFALARLAIEGEIDAVFLLHRQLEDVEAGLRTDRSRLHEIRATLAGISAASRLLHETSHIGPVRRNQIETMMDSELGRLERLLQRRTVAVPDAVDVDGVLEPLVLRQQARGNPVRWERSRTFGFGRPDDLAEAVNILLENAFRHGAGGETWIDVHETPDCVEIVVSDSGPGVDAAVREHIFEWGRRGSTSSGEGIGLSAARRLATDMGGYLQLVDSSAPGATFVLGLPTFSACARDRAHSA